MVFKIFNSEDANKILKIPLSLTGRDDSNFWIHSGCGQYTVRSAHKELNKKQHQERSGHKREDSPSGSHESRQGWKQLWKLNVKQKLKVFIWKGMNNALPVNELIFVRTKIGDPICTGCGEEEETVEHLFFRCKNAEQVWNISPVKWDGIDDQRGYFKRW